MPTYEQYAAYLRLIDGSQTYTNRGPLVRLLESRYAEKLGVTDASLVVLCSNATLGIQGFLQISSVSTWHIPSFTFAATVHAGIQSGKDVVLEDISPRTWMIPSSVVRNQKTEGLITVLPFGAPFDSSDYSKLDHVLIDAAASIGGARSWIGNIRENWGVVFSLHATKSFGIGEGGLVVFRSKELADKFRSWINFGFSGTRESHVAATNAKLSEVQAAVGLAVLDDWENEAQEWGRIRDMSDAVSRDLGIEPFEAIPRGTISPYWIISHADQRLVHRIESALKEMGIETRKWWSIGCHEMPAFKRLLDKDFQNTIVVGGTYLGLPAFRDMKENEFDLIRTIIKACL